MTDGGRNGLSPFQPDALRAAEGARVPAAVTGFGLKTVGNDPAKDQLDQRLLWGTRRHDPPPPIPLTDSGNEAIKTSVDGAISLHLAIHAFRLV